MSNPNPKPSTSDKTKQDKTPLQTQAASHIALRGHLTRRLNTARMVCDLSAQIGTPTMSLLNELKKAQSDLRSMFSKVELSCQDLMTLDITKIDSWQAKLAEDEKSLQKQDSELINLIADAELRLLPKPDSNRIPGARADRTKANEALKPKVLSREMSPVEFASWLQRFSAYYSSSNMNNCSLPEQQAYFRACIDSYLESRIQSKISSVTPILPTPGSISCFDLLNEQFLITHPVFDRRLDWFDAKQGINQKFTDFAQKLMRMGDECELAQMDINDLYVMRFLTSCSNIKLRERFLKETNPSQDKILQIAQNYEVSERFIKAINRSNHVSAHRVSHGGANSSAKSKDNRSSFRQKLAAFKDCCLRCGKKGDPENHTCLALKQTCYNCGKRGHLSPVCLAKSKRQRSGYLAASPRAQSAASSPRNQSRRNSTSRPNSSKGFTNRKSKANVTQSDIEDDSDNEVSSSLIAEYLN